MVTSLVGTVLLIAVIVNVTCRTLNQFSAVPRITKGIVVVATLVNMFVGAISTFTFCGNRGSSVGIGNTFLRLVMSTLISMNIIVSNVVVCCAD